MRALSSAHFIDKHRGSLVRMRVLMQIATGARFQGEVGFHTTNWNVVQAARQILSPETAAQALADFCQAYWPPLYAFLRRRGYSASDAQDLTQGFFLYLLEQNILSRVYRERGRLRSFLLRALQNFLANEHDRTHAAKRGGGLEIVPLDEHLAAAEVVFAATTRFDETACYDRTWVATLVGRAWKRLQEEYHAAGKAPLLEALEPFLLGGNAPAPRPEEVAARLDLPHSTLRTSLLALRRRYRDLLRQEVALTVTSPEQIDEEMRYLYHLLASPACSSAEG